MSPGPTPLSTTDTTISPYSYYSTSISMLWSDPIFPISPLEAIGMAHRFQGLRPTDAHWLQYTHLNKIGKVIEKLTFKAGDPILLQNRKKVVTHKNKTEKKGSDLRSWMTGRPRRC
jgi:hypothetical protein